MKVGYEWNSKGETSLALFWEVNVNLYLINFRQSVNVSSEAMLSQMLSTHLTASIIQILLQLMKNLQDESILNLPFAPSFDIFTKKRMRFSMH